MIRAVGFASQVQVVFGVFLRDWPFRITTLGVPIVSAAGVTFILVSILALSNGITDAIQRAGGDDVAVVTHRDAQTEMSSRLSDDEVAAVIHALNALPSHDGSRVRVVSQELVQTVDTLSRGGEAGAQLLARGISASGIQLRKELRIVEGRLFTPGKLEVIVGRRLADDFAGLSLGTTLTGGTQEWAIVGVFEAGGGTGESEVWMDLDSARSESGGRAPVSTVRVQLFDGSDLGRLREAVQRSSQLQVRVAGEREHQSRLFSQAITRIRFFAFGLALLLGVGAVVATVNAMSAAILARERAVTTLRVLGFARFATAMAVFTEATLLGLLGGTIGAAAAFLLADGYRLSILNGATSTPVGLSAQVTSASLVQGVALAGLLTVIAAIGPCVWVGQKVAMRFNET